MQTWLKLQFYANNNKKRGLVCWNLFKAAHVDFEYSNYDTWRGKERTKPSKNLHQKLTWASVADQHHSLAGSAADEIMTPPPAIALQARTVHHKTAELIQSEAP